jgi:hypothetical protein
MLDFLGKTKYDVPMGNQQERQIFDTGWLVGLLDGEGCFSLGKIKTGKLKRADYIFPQIVIASTSPEITSKAHTVLSNLDLAFHTVFYPSKKSNNKDYWSIRITGIKRIKRFMDVLFEYIECRKPQAEIMKRFVELRLSKPRHAPYKEENWLVDQLRLLNRRGQSESSESKRQAPNGDDVLRATASPVEVARNEQPIAVMAM